ncbi:MAG: RsfS/YbeB/iojap family protein, partial [Moorea sp. SIO3E2]|nr:RsfS/YbeB/iojap family protein [Moorena sp. SIO3E2]
MRDQNNKPSTLVTPDTENQDASYGLALTVAQAADDRKGADLVILSVSEVSYITDYFVIVTGFSRVQVRAISQWIEQQVEEAWNRLPVRTAGKAEVVRVCRRGRWPGAYRSALGDAGVGGDRGRPVGRRASVVATGGRRCGR